MATVVADSWDDEAKRVPLGNARIKAWADGRVWELKQGEDFTVNIVSLRGSLGSYAWRNKLNVRTTTRLLPPGTIRVCFTPKRIA